MQEEEVKGLWCFNTAEVIGLTASLSEGNINLARKMMTQDEDDSVIIEFPSSY